MGDSNIILWAGWCWANVWDNILSPAWLDSADRYVENPEYYCACWPRVSHWMTVILFYRRGSIGLMGKNNISSPSWLDAADLSICVWKKGTKHPKS
jgi:hypothetical protein